MCVSYLRVAIHLWLCHEEIMTRRPTFFFSRVEKEHRKWQKISNLPNCEEVSKGFGHFLWVNSDKSIVYPVAYISLLASSTALSNFIFMVWKHKVHTSTMYIKIVTQISCTHGTTFNMPTRSSRSPRTVPEGFPLLCWLKRKLELIHLVADMKIWL